MGMCGVGPHVVALLLAAAGDNPERMRSEAAFARLCGVCPIPASSGKTTRHRLLRAAIGGPTLLTIVLVRMRRDPATWAYVARRTQEGKPCKEISCVISKSNSACMLSGQSDATPTDRGDDLAGGPGADEGPGIVVVMGDVVLDCTHQVGQAGKAAPADPAGGDLSESALHHVEPRGTRGREVQVDPGVLVQPGGHLGVLVGPVVVTEGHSRSQTEPRWGTDVPVGPAVAVTRPASSMAVSP